MSDMAKKKPITFDVVTVRGKRKVKLKPVEIDAALDLDVQADVYITAHRRVRPLHLERDHDVSGVSGTGVVAYGARFPDGTIVLRWDTKVATTVIYSSAADLEQIVGHGGSTRIVYDEPPST